MRLMPCVCEVGVKRLCFIPVWVACVLFDTLIVGKCIITRIAGSLAYTRSPIAVSWDALSSHVFSRFDASSWVMFA